MFFGFLQHSLSGHVVFCVSDSSGKPTVSSFQTRRGLVANSTTRSFYEGARPNEKKLLFLPIRGNVVLDCLNVLQ